jgi:RimJ/RimL family protein N-acetyltransferase
MILRTDAFWLEPLKDDWAGHFSDFLRDGLNFKHTFTGSIPMRQIDVAAEWEAERQKKSLQWSIITHKLGFVGTTGLYSHRDIYRSWEFRILIGHPEALGHGIGTDATRLVVDWGFKRLNAHRIWLGVNAENVGAVKCYEKVGFKREGVLRDEIFCGGKYVDAIRMSILESEWTSPTLPKAESEVFVEK